MAVPVAVLGTLAALMACLYFALAARHVNLLGHVVAPGPGPATTLLVTDVQNSVGGWGYKDMCVCVCVCADTQLKSNANNMVR